jgi:hypothetical protein
MELKAIIHNEQGLIIKIAKNATITEHGIEVEEIPKPSDLYPVFSLIPAVSLDKVSIVKFNYDTETKIVSGYYDSEDVLQEINFELNEQNKFLLDNNALYWINNKITKI